MGTSSSTIDPSNPQALKKALKEIQNQEIMDVNKTYVEQKPLSVILKKAYKPSEQFTSQKLDQIIPPNSLLYEYYGTKIPPEHIQRTLHSIEYCQTEQFHKVADHNSFEDTLNQIIKEFKLENVDLDFLKDPTEQIKVRLPTPKYNKQKTNDQLQSKVDSSFDEQTLLKTNNKQQTGRVENITPKVQPTHNSNNSSNQQKRTVLLPSNSPSLYYQDKMELPPSHLPLVYEHYEKMPPLMPSHSSQVFDSSNILPTLANKTSSSLQYENKKALNNSYNQVKYSYQEPSENYQRPSPLLNRKLKKSNFGEDSSQAYKNLYGSIDLKQYESQAQNNYKGNKMRSQNNLISRSPSQENSYSEYADQSASPIKSTNLKSTPINRKFSQIQPFSKNQAPVVQNDRYRKNSYQL